jgi:hypothetical protein
VYVFCKIRKYIENNLNFVFKHIKHFHTLQTASVLDIQPDGKPINDESFTFQNSKKKIFEYYLYIKTIFLIQVIFLIKY